MLRIVARLSAGQLRNFNLFPGGGKVFYSP